MFRGGIGLDGHDGAPEDSRDVSQTFLNPPDPDETVTIYFAPTPGDGKGRVPAGANKTPLEVPGWSAADGVAIVVASPLLICGVLVSWLFMLLAILPLLFLKRWTVTLPVTPRIADGWKFSFVKAATFVLAMPALVLLWSWTFLVYFWILVVSAPIGLFRIVFLGKFSEIRHNLTILSTFNVKHQWEWGDVVRAICGQLGRQGFWELLGVRNLLLPRGVRSLPLIPVLKYGFMANPFIFTLETKFANQWTPKLNEDRTRKLLLDRFARLIGFVNPTAEEEKDIDKDVFAAHYPFPPNDTRRATNGLQYTDASGLLLLTKSTWDADLVGGPLEPAMKWIDTHAVLAELGYWNPFHVLVSVVAVSYRKDGSFEHPMWTVVGKGSRLSNCIYERLNDLFGKYGATDTVEWFTRPDITDVPELEVHEEGPAEGKTLFFR